MSMYSNEDLMWQRLKDLQTEAENRRLARRAPAESAGSRVKLLAQRVWLLAGLATRRPPRHSWSETSRGEESRSRVA